MELLPAYEDAHLAVAAVRILSHRDGRSPTPEEVAGLLGFSTEKVYVLVHELRKLGILRALESPFDLRLDVGDPAPLETLPRGADGPSIEGELTEFQAREKEKQEKMERMLRGGEGDRRRQERVARLEKEFMKFKPKAGALEGLFKPNQGAGAATGDSADIDSEAERPADERPSPAPPPREGSKPAPAPQEGPRPSPKGKGKGK
jgi:hypothetical protein